MAHLFSSYSYIFFFFFISLHIYFGIIHTEQAKKYIKHKRREEKRQKSKGICIKKLLLKTIIFFNLKLQKSTKMYNFNTSLSTPLLGVGVDFCSNTPRTPEILNSLIAMTNPFEYSYTSATSQNQSIPTVSSSNGGSLSNLLNDTSVIACKLENSFIRQQYDNNSQSNCSSSSSLESPSTTPLHMASTVASTTPSLQQVSMIKY